MLRFDKVTESLMVGTFRDTVYFNKKGVFEIGPLCLCGYNLCLFNTNASNFTAGVRELGEFKLHWQLVSVCWQ